MTKNMLNDEANQLHSQIISCSPESWKHHVYCEAAFFTLGLIFILCCPCVSGGGDALISSYHVWQVSVLWQCAKLLPPVGKKSPYGCKNLLRVYKSVHSWWLLMTLTGFFYFSFFPLPFPAVGWPWSVSGVCACSSGLCCQGLLGSTGLCLSVCYFSFFFVVILSGLYEPLVYVPVYLKVSFTCSDFIAVAITVIQRTVKLLWSLMFCFRSLVTAKPWSETNILFLNLKFVPYPAAVFFII